MNGTDEFTKADGVFVVREEFGTMFGPEPGSALSLDEFIDFYALCVCFVFLCMICVCYMIAISQHFMTNERVIHDISHTRSAKTYRSLFITQQINFGNDACL